MRSLSRASWREPTLSDDSVPSDDRELGAVRRVDFERSPVRRPRHREFVLDRQHVSHVQLSVGVTRIEEQRTCQARDRLVDTPGGGECVCERVTRRGVFRGEGGEPVKAAESLLEVPDIEISITKVIPGCDEVRAVREQAFQDLDPVLRCAEIDQCEAEGVARVRIVGKRGQHGQQVRDRTVEVIFEKAAKGFGHQPLARARPRGGIACGGEGRLGVAIRERLCQSEVGVRDGEVRLFLEGFLEQIARLREPRQMEVVTRLEEQAARTLGAGGDWNLLSSQRRGETAGSYDQTASSQRCQNDHGCSPLCRFHSDVHDTRYWKLDAGR
jgi:hypothetical protein